jgi:hypothetical protein
MKRLPLAVRDAFEEGYYNFKHAVPHMPPLAGEHNLVAFQSDFVARMRVAVRLFLARIGLELWRGREARACIVAIQAGRYLAEYRRQWAHLLRLGPWSHTHEIQALT